jgi:kinesin family protein 4/21/27
VASAELRKEIAKLKESNSTLHQHTVALEARLAKSEAHSHDHGAQIERHEKDAAKREAAYRDLEAHINLLDTSKDNKVLLAELEQRDSRIAELEKQHETIRDEERANLQKAVAEKAVQVELREQVSGLQSSAKAGQESKSMSKKLSSVVLRDITPPASPPPTDEDTDGDDQGAELRRLKQLLQELSARCTDAESRYSEAEGKITELTTQLSEVKLIHDEIDDVLPLSPGMTSPSDDVSENGSTVQTPRTQELSISPKGSRRGSRPVSSGSMVGAKGKDFLGGRGFREYRAARSVRLSGVFCERAVADEVRPQSLSQELSSAQSLGLSSRASWGGPSSLLLGASPTRLSMPVMQEQLRSQRSLEAELKFVHRVCSCPSRVASRECPAMSG